MGKEDNINKPLRTGKDLLKDMVTETGYLYNALTSIGTQISDAINNAVEGMDEANTVGKKIAKTYERDITNSIRASARGMDKLVALQLKINKGENESVNIQKELEKNQAKRAVLDARELALKLDGVEVDEEIFEQARRTLGLSDKQLLKLKEQNKENMRKGSFTSILSKSLGGLAIKIDKTGTLSGILKGNFKETVTWARAGEIGMGALFATAIKGVIELDKIQSQYSKSFALTNEEAQQFQGRMADIALSSGDTAITLLTTNKVMAEISATTGIFAKTLRSDIVLEAAKLSKKLGLSAEGMTNLAFNAQVTGMHMRDQSRSMLRAVNDTELMYGIEVDKNKDKTAAHFLKSPVPPKFYWADL